MIATIRKWLAATIGASHHVGSTRAERRKLGRADRKHRQETDISVARWVADTWKRSEKLRPGKDGRLRLRSQDSLDICASPEMLSEAVSAFAGWIDDLRLQGISVESRSPDGWRVCAVRDQVALAIRVRERLQRVAMLQGTSRLVERLLGGGDEATLVPSSQLELQIMRHGISVASIAFRAEASAECYTSALDAMHQLWGQEARYQRRLRELAEARNAPRTDHNGIQAPQYGMQPLAVRHELPASHDRSAPIPASLRQTRRQAIATVDHPQRRLIEAFEQLEKALLAAPSHLQYSGRMTASLATLSASCRPNSPANGLGGLVGLANGSRRVLLVRPGRGRQERVVA